MFAKLGALLLQRYLGNYVEGLGEEKLEVKVWEGKIELKQLRVKAGALDFLHLPITVKSGTIERIYVHANWARLSSEPVRVELHKVVLVAGPRTSFKIDETEERCVPACVRAEYRGCMSAGALSFSSCLLHCSCLQAERDPEPEVAAQGV